MLFDLQLLGKPDAAGNADVIENRTLASASIEDAVRTAKDIVLNTPVPGIYGFRLMRNGLEVFHCYWIGRCLEAGNGNVRLSTKRELQWEYG